MNNHTRNLTEEKPVTLSDNKLEMYQRELGSVDGEYVIMANPIQALWELAVNKYESKFRRE